MYALRKAQIKRGSATQDLWQIAETGDPDQLRSHLASGAELNAYNDSGMTPLMVAAYHGRREMVTALLEHGAELNAANSEGLTAAMLADDAGHEEIVRTLVALGVRRNRTTPTAESLPIRAVQVGPAEATGDPAAASPGRPPGVRTLSEPPDIWDLVHETRKEFHPGSAFIGRLTGHPLMLVAILLMIVGLGALWFTTLRSRSGTDTLATSGQPERSTSETIPKTRTKRLNTTPSSAKKSETTAPRSTADASKLTTPLSSKPARSIRNASSWDQQFISQSAGAEKVADSISSGPRTAVADRVGLSSRHFVPRSRRPNAGGSTADAERVDASSSVPVARTNNKDSGETANTASKSDNEKGASRATVRKDKDSGPQLNSPPKSSSTPKAKVIPWP